MFFLRKISAKIFASVTYGVLVTTGWKRKTVEANLKHVTQGTLGGEGAGQELKTAGLNPRRLYRQMLKNLTCHVGELLFCFDIYKNLPEDCESYPFSAGGEIFELAEGAGAVIEKMRKGGIFLTAHYGNYEASGAWLCALGVPLKASFIPLKPGWLNQMVYEKIRCVKGRPYSISAKTPREFLNLLDGKTPPTPYENSRSGLRKPAPDKLHGDRQLFCLLADQDCRIGSALDGTFLGQPAKINPLPDFLLGHRPKTPVFFCWIEETRDRLSGKLHRTLHAKEAATYQPDTDRGSIVDEAYRNWLEERIHENPALWYGWTHRRFRSKNPEIY
ncbi:MAG: lysophospholipid acyltransferase family protein [Fibrobacter sp.]|nr:lysophospholipid acyltransferase family protein [Fibrobacter sp.]